MKAEKRTKIMKNTKIIYQEETIIFVKYFDKRCSEGLNYRADIKIKESGKLPIEAFLKFDDIYPDLAPMPPEEHTFKASSIGDLQSKLSRWFNKWGYILK